MRSFSRLLMRHTPNAQGAVVAGGAHCLAGDMHLCRVRRYLMSKITLVTALLALTLGGAVAVPAQSPPPVQGTMALEGTMKKLYRGVNVIIVTTMDGVEHAYHFTKDLVVHGGKTPGVDALEGLREGSTVVIHYTAGRGGPLAQEVDRVGDEGLYVAEGRVTRLERGRKQISIAYDNGAADVFELTDRAASEALNEDARTAVGPDRVVIYYRDENGRKIVHFFKKMS
jgi:hypothetical protein